MARWRTYAVALAVLGASVGSMVWSAQRPGEGVVHDTAAALTTVAADVAAWYRAGPGDGRPDWDAASQQVHDADPVRGARAMVDYGCGACHVIPGVTGARGTVGPPLAGFGDRAYVAGVLPNDPGGLVRWLIDPPAHAPRTAMPDLGVTEADARDMAAYLYATGGL